jgi:hypothetical protein
MLDPGSWIEQPISLPTKSDVVHCTIIDHH